KDVVRSFAVRGGLGPALQALAALPGIQCVVGREAAELARTTGGYQVRTSRGELIQARRVALAVPPDAARRLLAPAFPGLAGRLAHIETRLVRSLGLVLRDSLPQIPRLTGLV